MNPRRRRLLIAPMLTVLVAVCLATAVPGVGATSRDRDRPRAAALVSSVDGRELFLGSDFDSACYDTARLEPALDRLAAVAATIRESGRRVVFTVAPNKTLVEAGALRGVVVPLGRCAVQGLAAQRRLLATYDDPAYLPISEPLARDRRQVYWHDDSHWTSVGASVYATRLARRLDPRVARSLRYVPTYDARASDLGALLVPPLAPEVAPALVPGPAVTVTASAVANEYFWTSSPRNRAHRGRTTVIGDSFTYLGLPVISPVFANGRFVWPGAVPRSAVLAAISAADTVVIEVVQRNLASFELARPGFARALAAALGAPDARTSGPTSKGRPGRG